MRDLQNHPVKFTKTAKQYQFRVFYERELRLWGENPVVDGIPLRIWLYHNRLQYLGKAPDQLSELEIMRGFTISGLLKGYTAFDTSLMHNVIEKYDIRSVYDPCAGWGERMLYCYHNSISYHGIDINEKLRDGYERMIRDLGMVEQDIVFVDSAQYIPDYKADAVMTCPPYGSLEHYTDMGAENLSDTEFLRWWKKVVENSKTTECKYFCFQVNRKWKDRMSEVVLDCGFNRIDEFVYRNNRSSHMTRTKGRNNKKEYESMVVFERTI